MTHYQHYMQQIHNQGTAMNIELAVSCLTQDVIDYLIQTGVKPGSPLLKKIKDLQKYEYRSKSSCSDHKHKTF